MCFGEDLLLDQIAFDPMRRGTYFRAHPSFLRDGRRVDPLSANPYSTARLALQRSVVRHAPVVSMFYVATTAAGALFEALLRTASILPGRRVYMPRSKLAGQCLSIVQLERKLEIIPLGLPGRKIVVTDPQRDARWRELIGTADHHDTHVAAVAVYKQVIAAGQTHTGLSWPSIQDPLSAVYLLYDPPLQRTDWRLKRTVALDSQEGDAYIAHALKAAGYIWLADPSGQGYTPDPSEEELA